MIYAVAGALVAGASLAIWFAVSQIRQSLRVIYDALEEVKHNDHS